MQDAAKKGRMHRGEAHGMSKLTTEEVLEIRRLLAKGNQLQREIAEDFDVNQQAVSQINCGKSWEWLK